MVSLPGVVGSTPTGVIDYFSFFVWAHFLSRAIAQKVSFGIFIQHINLLVLSDKTLLVSLSLTCSFAANCHLKFPRPCSSVGRATVICSDGRWRSNRC